MFFDIMKLNVLGCFRLLCCFLSFNILFHLSSCVNQCSIYLCISFVMWFQCVVFLVYPCDCVPVPIYLYLCSLLMMIIFTSCVFDSSQPMIYRLRFRVWTIVIESRKCPMSEYYIPDTVIKIIMKYLNLLGFIVGRKSLNFIYILSSK